MTQKTLTMHNSKPILSTLLISFCAFLVVTPNNAQADWWDQIKKLLGDNEQIMQLALNDEQVAKALKQALSVGSASVIEALQQNGAFANNPNLHINLPPSLARVGKVLDKIGLGQWTNELEAKLNEAAEQAIPAAGPILLTAINNLTIQDIQAIYQGKNDAATQYFKSQMSEPIAQALEPIIKENLDKVEALKLYDDIMSKYQSLPFVPNVSNNLVALVKTEAMTAMFAYLAKEEAAIRNNPEKRTTELLKQVFGK